VNISGPNADPYGSGVPNLLAYALQLNPATARESNVPQPSSANGHLRIVYYVPNKITDINYVVQVSTDLQNWNSGSSYTTVLSSTAYSGGVIYTVQDTLPTSDPQRFMRLVVTQK
jgi:hypothetical protein